MSEQQHMQELRLDIDRISFRNEDNGWTVLKGSTPDFGNPVTAVGHFTAINPGESYQLFGQWIEHKTFGRQFQIDRSVPVRPTTEAGIIKYLSSGVIKGLGPKTALRIVKHFKAETLNILDAQPSRLLDVPNIGKKKGQTIIDGWFENRAIHEVMMFLNNHGVSPIFATRLFRTYGKDTISTVSRDPYRLAYEVRGIGFVSADKIARELGIAADSEQRIRAAIIFLLNQSADKGHCYLNSKQLINELMQTLNLDLDLVTAKFIDCLTALNESGKVHSEWCTTHEGSREHIHYPSSLLIAEASVAKRIADFTNRPLTVEQDRLDAWLKRYCDAAGTELSEEQFAAVKASAQNRVFILTGGPGVGKTTTANAIIRLLKAMGKGVTLCAPTGRAAQRLTEVSAVQAKTIHRLLEWQPHEGVFAKNEESPLTAQVVICDEASMLDIKLADALIRATPPTAQLILIGDVDQLPSVGPGNVLRDLIDSNAVPFTRLETIFRQAATSDIVRIAHGINRGEQAAFTDLPDSDCQFIKHDEPEQIRAAILDYVCRQMPKQGWDPIKDVQILTPMNRGELGTQTLNEILQETLNPKRPQVPEFRRGSLILRQGDKVIQCANNYDLGVFNGDIGIVQHATGQSDKVHIQFGDRLVAYEPEQSIDLKLAYAITIHKSQGSEFPAVVLPVSMQHYVMLQRNLIYTGLTRAKKLAIFAGTKKALNFATQNQTAHARQTRLVERIRTEI